MLHRICRIGYSPSHSYGFSRADNFEPGRPLPPESRAWMLTDYIDTLMFKENTAFQPLKSPLDLVVVGD